jgi:hypothetical protein
LRAVPSPFAARIKDEAVTPWAKPEFGFIDNSGRLSRRKLIEPRPACGRVDNAAFPHGPQARQQQQQPVA